MTLQLPVNRFFDISESLLTKIIRPYCKSVVEDAMDGRWGAFHYETEKTRLLRGVFVIISRFVF
eukprot:snap_masked-scaffold_6-processed-gene-9.9-mRNA-1 protein AED:1.00 eAED:1.00 QI:0/0/0/0/1/1/2/0/63